MRKRIVQSVLALLVVAAAALAVDFAGSYSGSWADRDNSRSGTFQMKLVRTGDAWSSEVSFAFEGEEIAGKVVSTKLDGDTFEVVYDSEIDGGIYRTKLAGKLAGGKITGTYNTAGLDGSPVGSGSIQGTKADA